LKSIADCRAGARSESAIGKKDSIKIGRQRRHHFLWSARRLAAGARLWAGVFPAGNPASAQAFHSMRGVLTPETHAPRLPTLGLPFTPGAGVGSGTKQMKARVIIEYDLLPGDRIVVRDREEQRWTACKTVLALPGSATVKVELLEVPLMPDHAPSIRAIEGPGF
jgi:hypothetical protein